MGEIFENLLSNVHVFDMICLIILLYNVVQCFLKGFSLSLISFMKWILSTIITIVLVPKLQPVVSEYIDSEFVNNIGLGIGIFLLVFLLLFSLEKL